VLLVASIFTLRTICRRKPKFDSVVNRAFPRNQCSEAVKLSAPARNFLKQQPEVGDIFVNFPQFRAIGVTLKPESASNGLAGMVERLTGKSFGYPGYRFMFPFSSIFNDPGKEFEVQLIGPDLNQLAELEQQITQQIRGYLES